MNQPESGNFTGFITPCVKGWAPIVADAEAGKDPGAGKDPEVGREPETGAVPEGGIAPEGGGDEGKPDGEPVLPEGIWRSKYFNEVLSSDFLSNFTNFVLFRFLTLRVNLALKLLW